MKSFDPAQLHTLYLPPEHSHKGQNGKLMVIGGSHLFHAASLWALQIATRIVDMVFYSSIAENNLLVEELKKEFRGGIIVRRDDIDSYIQEAQAVVIGPGMVRTEKLMHKDISNLEDINRLKDEGEQSYYLTRYVLEKHPDMKWIIDAGALQMMDPEWLKPLSAVVITPHALEFERVFKMKATKENVAEIAKKYQCIVLLKSEADTVCTKDSCVSIVGGNAGMTKGGTGDVLAGLIGALACNNDLLLATQAGSYFNKKAGESLFERVGYYFNASDLADEIPQVMKQLLIKKVS
jgi:hydroxyethylthiazole kinase-like uncharacterized protein yjeF